MATVYPHKITHLRPLAGVTIYLDLNGDGMLDLGEPTTISGRSGTYAFTGLAAGTYQVCQISSPSSSATPVHRLVSVAEGAQERRENLWEIVTVAVSAGVASR